MDPTFFLVQAFNGLQYGLLLFLVASGLTLIFGIMGIINLAHGAFYMLGAYIAYWLAGATGSFILAVVGALVLTAVLGYVIERLLMHHLYHRNHLDQVLLTYGLILVLDETQSLIWGHRCSRRCRSRSGRVLVRGYRYAELFLLPASCWPGSVWCWRWRCISPSRRPGSACGFAPGPATARWSWPWG